MRGSIARHIRQLEEQLAAAATLVAVREDEIRELQNTLRLERLARVSAQRGLVAYLHRYTCLYCGKKPVETGIEVGYNPDTDPVVIQEIADGKIPSLNDPHVIRDIAQAWVARKQAEPQAVG